MDGCCERGGERECQTGVIKGGVRGPEVWGAACAWGCRWSVAAASWPVSGRASHCRTDLAAVREVMQTGSFCWAPVLGVGRGPVSQARQAVWLGVLVSSGCVSSACAMMHSHPATAAIITAC